MALRGRGGLCIDKRGRWGVCGLSYGQWEAVGVFEALDCHDPVLCCKEISSTAKGKMGGREARGQGLGFRPGSSGGRGGVWSLGSRTFAKIADVPSPTLPSRGNPPD